MEVGEFLFPNGNRAGWVRAAPGEEAAPLLRALGLERPRALMLLLGGADAMPAESESRLRQLFSRGLAMAAVESGALVMDGGTRTGIMALMGQGMAGRERRAALLGVVPEGRITWPGRPTGNGEQAPLEPNHSHFVLVDSDAWGGETGMMFRLATGLERGAPVVVVLINGGPIARDELLLAVRQHWPIIVVQGSGRLADELAGLLQQPLPRISDPGLAEIVADGDICLFPQEGPPDTFKRLILRQLRQDEVLMLSWERFAYYDSNARRQQSDFRRIQASILLLGLISTAMALLRVHLVAEGVLREGQRVTTFLQYCVVVLAAAMAALVAAATRFKSGNKWLLLRAHAESIKRELFRYRCHLSSQRHPLQARAACEQHLASRMKVISARLMQSEANASSLRSFRGTVPPPGALAPGDDGLGPLSPGQYLRFRLEDQLRFYRRKIDLLDRQFLLAQWLIVLAGAAGSVLAALRWDLWVPLTTALVMAITSYLTYQQAEGRLLQCHRAATDLDDIKAWWSALSVDEQGEPRNFDTLVDSTELVLQSELTGWLQEMRDALARLHARQDKSPQEAGLKAPHPVR
ncbi:DUF4231 domain-containing protein [Pyxidicoccus sp. 3LFB2]